MLKEKCYCAEGVCVPSLPAGKYECQKRTQNTSGNPAVDEARAELEHARDHWPQFNSAHEGFAVLCEEVDELKAHVWTNQRRRDLSAMRKEAIQVAAMALRFAIECCDEVAGRK